MFIPTRSTWFKGDILLATGDGNVLKCIYGKRK